MIKNKRQLAIAQEKLKELNLGREEFLSKCDGENEIVMSVGLDSFDSLISEISDEINEYLELSSGNLEVISGLSIHEFHKVLIGGRIALNLTQEKLAEKVGIAPQQIQRYEYSDYEAANLSRIREIAYALNIDCRVVDIKTKTDFEFSVPIGTSQSQIDDYAGIIHREGLFQF